MKLEFDVAMERTGLDCIMGVSGNSIVSLHRRLPGLTYKSVIWTTN